MKKILSVILLMSLVITLCFGIVGCIPSEKDPAQKIELETKREEALAEIDRIENEYKTQISNIKAKIVDKCDEMDTFITITMLEEYVNDEIRKERSLVEKSTDVTWLSYYSFPHFSRYIWKGMADYEEEWDLDWYTCPYYFLANSTNDTLLRIEGATEDGIEFAITQAPADSKYPWAPNRPGRVGVIKLETNDEETIIKCYSDNDVTVTEEGETVKNCKISKNGQYRFDLDVENFGYFYFIVEKEGAPIGYVVLDCSDIDRTARKNPTNKSKVVKAVVFDAEQRNNITEEQVWRCIEKAKKGENGETEEQITVVSKCMVGRIYDDVSIQPKKDKDGNVYNVLTVLCGEITCSRQKGTLVSADGKIEVADKVTLKNGASVTWRADLNESETILIERPIDKGLYTRSIMMIKSNATDYSENLFENVFGIRLKGSAFKYEHGEKEYNSFLDTAKRLFESKTLSAMKNN